MKKYLYYVQTNGYDMVVSMTDDGVCMYATDLIDIPYLTRYEDDEKEKIAAEYLAAIEDDSSWENATEEGIKLIDLLDGNEILAWAIKEL